MPVPFHFRIRAFDYNWLNSMNKDQDQHKLIDCAPGESIIYAYEEIQSPSLFDQAKKIPMQGILKSDDSEAYFYLKVHDDFILKLYPLLKESEASKESLTLKENQALPKIEAFKENQSLKKNEHNLNYPKQNIQMPDYFSATKNIGAHITVVYREEWDLSQKMGEVGNSYLFTLDSLIKVSAFNKIFYVIVVHSKELTAIRQKYGLSTKLNYHGLLVPFHITIAVQLSNL